MATRRMISKSISTSRKLAQASQFAALLFTWLIPHCDDGGNMNGDAHTVKMKVIPGRPETIKDVEKALKEMTDAELVEFYEVRGEKYLHIVNWENHQTLRLDRATWEYPPKDGIPKLSGNRSATARQPVVAKSAAEVKISKGKISKEGAELPEWLNKKKWQEWLEYRRERRLTCTPITINRQLKLLEAHRNDHEEMIEKSITNGWQGLFPPKGGTPAKRSTPGKFDNVPTTKV